MASKQIHKCETCGAPTGSGGIYEPNNDLGQQDAAAAFAILGLTGRMEALEELCMAAQALSDYVWVDEITSTAKLTNTGFATYKAVMDFKDKLAALDGAGGGDVDGAQQHSDPPKASTLNT